MLLPVLVGPSVRMYLLYSGYPRIRALRSSLESACGKGMYAYAGQDVLLSSVLIGKYSPWVPL
jgi:hypothetical protein